MFSCVKSAALCGIESRIISVEADVSDGLPMFVMVGYLAAEVKEAQDRVRTAIRNSGFQLHPRRVTVNLAPADLRKSGAGFDLPIAAAVLAAYGYLPSRLLERVFLAGELSLDGSLHGIHGVLGMAAQAKHFGCTACIVPRRNAQEAAVIQGIDVFGAGSLKEVVDHIISTKQLQKIHINIEETFSRSSETGAADFADIKGQRSAKRAAQIAAAGRHNLLLNGPPGSGKTMIAQRIPGILPPMSMEEALEVSQIHSVAGILPEQGILTKRPFRMPHHTVTPSALAGGGSVPRPGEISLAHRGVLYLDELPEFQKETLEILRQPLEEGEVRIARSSGMYVFPADFMLVASRNPCKCGYYPDRSRCTCSEWAVRQYLHRVSRPLMDRIDLYAEVQPVPFQQLALREAEEEGSTQQLRTGVMKAHEMQQERYRGTRFRFNSELTPSALRQFCTIDDAASSHMQRIYEQKQLTARSYHRILKTARTIADLEGSRDIRIPHLNEAVFYRPVEQT